MFEGLELGFLNALALLDEAQPFTQHLAGVLLAPGLHQRHYQLVLMFAQNDVARGHVVGSESARTARRIKIGRLCQGLGRVARKHVGLTRQTLIRQINAANSVCSFVCGACQASIQRAKSPPGMGLAMK